MAEMIYTGPLARGWVRLPGGDVPFTRGVPVEVPAAQVELLSADEWAPAEPAPLLGSVAEVLEAATSPQVAAQLLDAELAGKNRKSLVAQLSRLATDITNPEAEEATAS